MRATPTPAPGKVHLVGLTADQFRHPLDLEATRTLKQLSGLDGALRLLVSPLAEQFFHLENIASSVQVGPQQLPDLHDLLQEACQVMDLQPPHLYVRQHPVPNAYTFAMRGEHPFVVLHTSLIDMLTPAEIQVVIAHELGHLKCDHGVYLTLASLLTLAAGQLPLGEALTLSLQQQMMEWVRCAEFTCDRAALLVAQDARVVASVLMKLAGGSPSLAGQLNLDAFLDQARQYDAISDSQLGAALKQMRTQDLTHPVPVLRAREIDRWAHSQAYETLLHNRSIQYNNGASSKGGWRNW